MRGDVTGLVAQEEFAILEPDPDGAQPMTVRVLQLSITDLGIAANATERAVRGEPRTRPPDPIYRANLRGDSTHTRARTEAVAAEIRKGDFRVEPGKSTLVATRRDVERGWRATSNILLAQGHPELAAQVRRFVEQMGPARTDKELITQELQKRLLDTRMPDPHRVR